MLAIGLTLLCACRRRPTSRAAIWRRRWSTRVRRDPRDPSTAPILLVEQNVDKAPGLADRVCWVRGRSSTRRPARSTRPGSTHCFSRAACAPADGMRNRFAVIEIADPLPPSGRSAARCHPARLRSATARCAREIARRARSRQGHGAPPAGHADGRAAGRAESRHQGLPPRPRRVDRGGLTRRATICASAPSRCSRRSPRGPAPPPFGVTHDDAAPCIGRVDGDEAIQIRAWSIGGRMPLNCRRHGPRVLACPAPAGGAGPAAGQAARGADPVHPGSMRKDLRGAGADLRTRLGARRQRRPSKASAASASRSATAAERWIAAISTPACLPTSWSRRPPRHLAILQRRARELEFRPMSSTPSPPPGASAPPTSRMKTFIHGAISSRWPAPAAIVP